MSYIPEKLKIFVRNQTKVHRTVCGQKQIIFVKKAFATDAAKPNTHETAERWAKTAGYKWNPVTKKNVPRENGFIIVDVDNKPFKGLKIYDIDIRSEGGRAYKVQTEEGWAFDCREDTILDTIIEEGIGKNGYMKGEFIWAKAGSQMKITRIGSALYQKAQKDMGKIKKGKIKNKDLEYGSIYINARGDIELYLGKEGGKFIFLRFSEYRTFGEGWVPEQRDRIREYQKASKTWEASPRMGNYGFFQSPERRQCGWKPRDPRSRWPQPRKSHSFIEKLGQLTKEEIDELLILEKREQ